MGVESRRAAVPVPRARARLSGAVFFEAAGWERPQRYESNAPLEEFGDLVAHREAEWDSRWWSPIVDAEHLAMRERAAMFDLSAFCIFDVIGPVALDALQKVSLRQIDVPLWARSSTSPWLSPGGGFKSDLTVMRLGEELLRVVTGGAHGMAECAASGPPTGRRVGAARRPDERLDDARALGSAGERRARRADERRHVERGVSFAT